MEHLSYDSATNKFTYSYSDIHRPYCDGLNVDIDGNEKVEVLESTSIDEIIVRKIINVVSDIISLTSSYQEIRHVIGLYIFASDVTISSTKASVAHYGSEVNRYGLLTGACEYRYNIRDYNGPIFDAIVANKSEKNKTRKNHVNGSYDKAEPWQAEEICFSGSVDECLEYIAENELNQFINCKVSSAFIAMFTFNPNVDLEKETKRNSNLLDRKIERMKLNLKSSIQNVIRKIRNENR